MTVDLDGFRRRIRAAIIFTSWGSTSRLPKTPVAASGTGSGDVRNRLDKLHAQIRVSSDARRLCDLVDEYLLVAATLARPRFGMTTYPPAGAVLPAAVVAIEDVGPVGPVVMGDNIPAPGHTLA